MIKVYIPGDSEFNYEECENLYNQHQEKIGDNQNFRELVRNTLFYSFYDDEKFLGCIYYYLKNGRVYVNAYAGRHTHLQNIECLKMSLGWFTTDIYAYSIQKPAIYCLLKCGFKKVSENTYKYERK